jgi:hypothetical protein
MRRGFRKCRKCGVAKRPQAYPPQFYGGPANPAKEAVVCKACKGEAERKREQQRSQWHRSGRECRRCGERRDSPAEISDNPQNNNAVCVHCRRARQAERKRERVAEDAAYREHLRQKNRRWRLENPEKEAAAKRKWKAKRRKRFEADPELYREHLENQRIYYTFWQEQARGRRLKVADGVVTTEGPEVPIDPLLRAIENLMRRRGVEINSGQADSEFEGFCESIGVHDRSVRDWRNGNRHSVRMSTVDRVLTNAGWNWWDVWDEGDPGYETVRRAFEGDEELAA